MSLDGSTQNLIDELLVGATFLSRYPDLYRQDTDLSVILISVPAPLLLLSGTSRGDLTFSEIFLAALIQTVSPPITLSNNT